MATTNEEAVEWFLGGVYAANGQAMPVQASSARGQAVIALSEVLGVPRVQRAATAKIAISGLDGLMVKYTESQRIKQGTYLDWKNQEDKAEILRLLCEEKPTFANTLKRLQNTRLTDVELEEQWEGKAAAAAGEANAFKAISGSSETGLALAQRAIGYLSLYGGQNPANAEVAKNKFIKAIRDSNNSIPYATLYALQQHVKSRPFANDRDDDLRNELMPEIDKAVGIAFSRALQTNYKKFGITLELDPTSRAIKKFILDDCNGKQSDITKNITGEDKPVLLFDRRVPQRLPDIQKRLADEDIKFSGDFNTGLTRDCTIEPPPPPPVRPIAPPMEVWDCEGATPLGKTPDGKTRYRESDCKLKTMRL